MASSSFWEGKTVFITGASSGIGAALALELARHGARLGLFARRRERIEQVAERVRSEGGFALAFPGNVAERDEVHRAAEKLARESGPVDVLVANAGRGMHGENELDGRTVAACYAVNFLGAVYALEAVLPAMRARGRGNVAVVSSGTALLPRLAASPTYASSKAAMGRYFEGIGRELQLEGVSVTVIYPGFVRTEMTSGHKFMPFALEPEEAARLIRRSIERGKRRFIFPRRTLWLGRLVQYLPVRVQVLGRQRFAGKPVTSGQEEPAAGGPDGPRE